MKNFLRNFGLLLCMFLSISLHAQEQVVTGKVTSAEDNLPLPGVSVTLQGTSKGTVTDVDGNYQINAPSGGNLVFSFLGTEAQTLTVGASTTLDVSLTASASALNEVVVTALGITQEKRGLGYAVQEIKTDALEKSGEQNIVSALQGQIAGAIISSAGGDPGGGTNIILRGVTSLSSGSNNQPLFVVDGIIMSNSTDAGNPLPSAGTNAFNAAEQFSNTNRAADINPNDVASISVLKGPAATALYGLRASNGAIIITTKSAKAGKMTVDVSVTGGMSQVAKSPRIQTRFIQGRLGEFIAEDDPTARSIFRSYGPLLEGSTDKIYDNFRDFYQTGTMSRNNISIGKGNDKGNVRLSLGYNYDKGIVPFSDFNRATAKVTALQKLTDRFTVSGSFGFTNSGGNRPPSGDKSIFSSLSYWPNSYDVNDYIKKDGSQNNITFGVVDNPKYLMYKSPRMDNNNRIIADGTLQYKVTDWLTAKYQLTYDTYHETRNRFVDSTFDVGTQVKGWLTKEHLNFREINSNVYLTAERQLTEKMHGSFMVGNAVVDSERPNSYFERGEGWKLPFTQDISSFKNFISRPYSPQHLRIVSYFADARVNFSDVLYLNVTGRNDIVSTLPAQNRSFFYPSANLSYNFSENLPKNNFLSYGKLRLSWAQVGKGTNPYTSGIYYDVTPNFPYGGTVSGYRRQSTTAEPDLKPERTTSIEVGTELRFAKNRILVDATYFTMDSKDQIVNAPVATSSGFSRYYTNIGLIRNKGIEVMVTGKLVKSRHFNWDMTLNGSKQRGEVVAMPDYLKEISYYESGGVALKVKQGSRLGDLWAFDYARAADGQILIGANGFPTVDQTKQIVMGNAFPDFLASLNNSFNFRGVGVSFLLEWKKGGDVMDLAEVNSVRNGVTQLTERRYERTVFKGVVKNADGTFTTNTNAVALDDNFYRSAAQFYTWGGFTLQDASWFRVRNLNLSYTLPMAAAQKTPFKGGIRATLTGTNLFLNTPFRGYDPDALAFGSGTNLVGFVGRNTPATRSYQLTLNFSL
jgi:TonB-linked SusC/RagA family outer membrane protein